MDHLLLKPNRTMKSDRQRLRLGFLLVFLVLSALIFTACNNTSDQSAASGDTAVLPQPQKLPTRPPSTATPTVGETPTNIPTVEPTDTPVAPVGVEESATVRKAPSSGRLPGAYVQNVSAILAATPGGRTLARIPAGSRVGILEQSGNGVWLKVQYQPDPDAESQTGWVRVSDLAVFANLDDLAGSEEVVADVGVEAETEDQVTTLGVATVVANRLNVRAGPGTDQPVVTALVRGKQVPLVGRTENGQWLKVQLPDETTGWAAAQWLESDIEINSLPVSGMATTTVPKPAPAQTTAGGKIVFQTRNGGDIFTINANGSGLRHLATGFDPSLSPDGKRVAFTRFSEPPGLWVINVDGTGAQQLYTANRPRSPTWTLDGQSIIFEQNNGELNCRDTPFGCYTDDQLRNEFGGNDCIDTPFGEYCIGDFNLTTLFETGLLRYNLADGVVRDLPATSNPSAPYHHPRSDAVLYLNRDGLSTTRDVGNDPPILLVQQSDLGPSVYSPDGEFVYTSRRSGDHWDIWRYRADGSAPQALTAPPGIREEAIHNVSPMVSPDGRSILFLTNRRGTWELWLMNADGGNPRPFAPQALADVDFEYGFARERMVDWGS